jgi:hypothetical protein
VKAIVTSLGYAQSLRQINDTNSVASLVHLSDQLRRQHAGDQEAGLPLAFLICKGRKWAMGAMMILWTLEKGYQVVGTPTPRSYR